MNDGSKPPSLLTATHSRCYATRQRLESYQASTRFGRFVWEFLLFGFKQGWACLFGGILLALLLLTKWFWPADSALMRYDFLFLAAILTQAALLLSRMETMEEAKTILIFHILGTLMELFKTEAGSWAYPEDCYFRIAHVPLFSGFMYASIGSYLARVTRILDMRYNDYPPLKVTALLAALIYVNFFSHHFMPDARGFLFLVVGVIFGPVWVHYKPYQTVRKMPLLLGFALVAFFIWLAENIGTFTAVWLYPHQHQGWKFVNIEKYGSWFLLMIVSFILVSFVHRPQPPDTTASPELKKKA